MDIKEVVCEDMTLWSKIFCDFVCHWIWLENV